MANIELTQPALVDRIEQVATSLHQPVEQVLEAAVQNYLDRLEEESIQAETDAFWRTYAEIEKAYPGEHVAMFGGQVVDHDTDVSVLDRRVSEHYGLLPVLIAPVTPPPAKELNWRGVRMTKQYSA